MTDAELEAIEARANAATTSVLGSAHGHYDPAYDTCADDVPALVAEVRRLKEELEDDDMANALRDAWLEIKRLKEAVIQFRDRIELTNTHHNHQAICDLNRVLF